LEDNQKFYELNFHYRERGGCRVAAETPEAAETWLHAFFKEQGSEILSVEGIKQVASLKPTEEEVLEYMNEVAERQATKNRRVN
jgi:hypothetical protein